jgi:hypothetical protein
VLNKTPRVRAKKLKDNSTISVQASPTALEELSKEVLLVSLETVRLSSLPNRSMISARPNNAALKLISRSKTLRKLVQDDDTMMRT